MAYVNKNTSGRTCSCIVCRKELSYKGIHTHYERAHLKLDKYPSGYNGKYTSVAKKAVERALPQQKEYLQNPKRCTNCDRHIEYRRRYNNFCSHSCSASYTNRGIKQSLETIEKRVAPQRRDKQYIECIVCLSQTLKLSKTTKFCSRDCLHKHRIKQANLGKTPMQVYRKACQFKFNLADFSNEFDFNLVEQYGWYKAKNRGNNLTGVSRDHCISVRYGYENNIPAKHIAHPANCKLMQHTENMKKNTDIEFSYENLLAKIADWNYKYN